MEKFNEYPIFNRLSKLTLNENTTREDLIHLHIKVENLPHHPKYHIDVFHSYMFRDYNTLIGYNKRCKKYNFNNDLLFPYGTGILGVCIIMATSGNEELAYKESELICPHPQSLLATKVVIELYKNHLRPRTPQSELDNHIKKMLEDDPVLLNTYVSSGKTNVNFLNLWVKHYLLAVIAAFKKQILDSGGSDILSLIYAISHQHFHGTVVHRLL